MVSNQAKEFRKKYPATIAWRINKHCDVIEKHLNPDEEVLYTFASQKNGKHTQFFHTFALALTNKRIILAQKRMFFGYFLLTITPDMFNDLKVVSGIIWGKIIIDTVKERVILSNIDKKALPEIETVITQYMMNEKRKYAIDKKIEEI